MVEVKQSQCPQMAAALAAGFVSDPLYRFLLPQDATRQTTLYDFFIAYLTQSDGSMDRYMTAPEGTGFIAWYDGDAPDIPLKGPQAALHQQINALSTVDRLYDGGYCLLDLMAVPASFQGQGKAREMVSFFLEHCRKVGKKPLAEIFEKKHIPFYEKFGFTLAHQTAVAEGLTSYIMEAAL